MPDPELEDLVAHLARSRPLGEAEARRLIDDVLSFLNEAPEDFIRRRHRLLQRAGYSNKEIFARLGQELTQRRFRAPDYSERQIRRIVYG